MVDYSLPPREENARVGRVANEARGKTRENCAEMCVLRAKTHIVRAVLEWTRSYAAGAPRLRLGPALREGHRRRRRPGVLPDAHDGRGVRGHDRL